jgi:hypothetical protein
MDTAMRLCPRFLILALALLWGGAALGGCSHSARKEHVPVSTELSIWNRAQSELIEIRIHGDEEYGEAENRLPAPLAVESSVDLPFVQHQYVTVFRRRVADGDPVAFTTGRGLDEVDAPGYTLMVFDQSFRLMPPGS